MPLFSTLDLVALAWFVGAWAAYAIVICRHAWGRKRPQREMNRYRDVWMRQMLGREMRMVDMQIVAALQNGTAFFASTSLIAIGGALTLLRSTDQMLDVLAMLPLGIHDVGAVGGESDRARGHLRLRVLQVRLVVPAVQLRRDHAGRDAARKRKGSRPKRRPTRCAPRGCSRPRDAISTAASARSSSRSAISAGSSARGC